MKKTEFYEMSFTAGKEYVYLGAINNRKDAIKTTIYRFHKHPKTKYGGWWKVNTPDGKIIRYGGRQYSSDGRGLNYHYFENELNERMTKQTKESENIKTLEKLEYYINSCGEWMLQIEQIMKKNAWYMNQTYFKNKPTGIICTDLKNRKALYINDEGTAYIKPTTDLSHILDKELKDDNTPYGGISFRGETLGDFIKEAGIDPTNTTLETVNKALKECGIMPLTL